MSSQNERSPLELTRFEHAMKVRRCTRLKLPGESANAYALSVVCFYVWRCWPKKAPPLHRMTPDGFLRCESCNNRCRRIAVAAFRL